VPIQMTKNFRVVVANFITDDLEPERRLLGDIADTDKSREIRS
jgi:hypothetical protein